MRVRRVSVTDWLRFNKPRHAAQNAPYEEAKRPTESGGRIVHDGLARGKQQEGHHHRDACVWLRGTDALHVVGGQEN